MENAIVASSNLFAIGALMAWAEYPFVFYAITASMLASIVYHLAERNKHNMPGMLKVSPSTEQVLLNMDRAAAVFLSLLVLSRVSIDFGKVAMAIVTLFFGAASEYGHVFQKNSDNARAAYIMMHCAWHVMAFGLVWLCAE